MVGSTPPAGCPRPIPALAPKPPPRHSEREQTRAASQLRVFSPPARAVQPEASSSCLLDALRCLEDVGTEEPLEKGPRGSHSIGSDDGLKRGLELIVMRDGQYLGKARVLRTWPDGAVCEVIPGTVEGNIREGDRVATRV